MIRVTLERPCPVGSKAVPQPLEAAAGTSIEDKMNFFSILLNDTALAQHTLHRDPKLIAGGLDLLA
jgi:hypothetical protein